MIDPSGPVPRMEGTKLPLLTYLLIYLLTYLLEMIKWRFVFRRK